MVKKMTARNKTVSIPNRLASFGTKGENKANESKGRVVIIPDIVFDNCKWSRINSTNGPTDVNGALIFTAIKITPSNNTQGADLCTPSTEETNFLLFLANLNSPSYYPSLFL